MTAQAELTLSADGADRALRDHGPVPDVRGGHPPRVPRRQGTGLRHRQGTGARRDAPLRGAGAGRGRDLRPPHGRRRGDRDPPAAPPGDRPRRRPPGDDGRDLRQGDRPGTGTRRAHAPLRPGHPLLLLGHHRRGLPAGAGPGLRLPATRHRSGRRRGHRRGRRQPGRVPRVAQPGRAVVPPGRLRRRGQRLGDLGAAQRPRPPSPRTPIAPRRTASRGSGSRTTTSRRSTRRPDRAVARARSGAGPTLLEVRTLRLWGHFEGDAQGYRTDLDEAPGRDPIPRYEQILRDAGVLDDAAVARTREAAGRRVEEAITFAKESPLPHPDSATAYVFA